MDNLTSSILSIDKATGAGPAPQGTSFDGSTDYLTKAGLTGSIDSKTFTISFFCYLDGSQTMQVYSSAPLADGATTILYMYTDGRIRLNSFNASNTEILEVTASLNATINQIKNTWISVQISMDMSNASNRYIYVNDVLQSPTWTTYTNENIIFTEDANLHIGASISDGNVVKGRLSHFFQDYTYRDLSIEANRRLFVDADLKPADASGLSPILYLPMTDASTAHINSGTGGNFTQNGTLATADRGANQFNCVATLCDATSYLLNTGGAGMVDSKVLTVSMIVNMNDSSVTYKPLKIGTGYIEVKRTTDRITVLLKNTSASTCLQAELDLTGISPIKFTAVHLVQVIVDMDSQANTKAFIDGVYNAWTAVNTFTTGSTLDLTLDTYIGDNSDVVNIGELWIDNTYTDLATTNPFWDADNNKPKPVRQVLSETGANPLVAMPISADYPELNLGSAGNFTKNGTGFTGVRGMSEYIARGIVVDGTNYLTGSIVCASLVKWLSVDGGATWSVTYANSVTVTNIGNGTDNGVVAYYFGFSDTINWATESNKNLITNQLGYPRTPEDVISESGWTPVLGLFFRDPANFGLNDYGTDYTETGTITAGADVII